MDVCWTRLLVGSVASLMLHGATPILAAAAASAAAAAAAAARRRARCWRALRWSPGGNSLCSYRVLAPSHEFEIKPTEFPVRQFGRRPASA